MMRFNRKTSYANDTSANGGKPSSIGRKSSSEPRTKEGGSNQSKDWSATAAGTGLQGTNISNLPIEIDIDPLLKDIVFSEDLEQKKLVNRLYRDIYYNDAICGAAVDMISTLPFSDFTLGGVSDKRALRTFSEAVERLNCRSIFPYLSTDHLVDGSFIGSLLYNKTSKKFFDIMPHRSDDSKISPMPFFGQDPLITVAIPESVRWSLQNDSTRVRQLRERLGDDVVNLLSQDAIELDPMSSIYIPRRTFTTGEGVSYFRRILPIYLIEKNLFRGTLVESSRRQRGILHLTLGDGDQWEPTLSDMDYMTELFNNADADPLGAIIATRMGVSADEIRQGGDFWKVNDIWDSTAQFKMRALGLSDSFLSGDANYACVSEDMLIPTSNGLLRIDQMVDSQHLPIDTSESEKDKEVPLDTIVQSRYANERTSSWKYSGYTDTLKVKTEQGNEVRCTGNHPFLAMDETGNTGWVKADDLEPGDPVCMPTKGMVREKPLPLDLTPQENLSLFKGVRKNLTQPEVMTPRLAYILGALVSEGYIVEDKKVVFTNGDDKFLERMSRFLSKEFGLKSSFTLRHSKGDSYSIQGKQGKANQDCYYLSIGSKTLIQWLYELGFVYRREGNELPSCNQEVPWSVMQADGESQLAFLAAYMEGDAHVNERIAWSSASERLLEQVQSMLFAHGVMAYRRESFVELGYKDSQIFFDMIERFVCTKNLITTGNRGVKPRPKYGFPSSFLTDFLAARKIGHKGKGTAYLNDYGEEITLTECRKYMHSLGGSVFMYDKYDDGGYDGFLERLQLISESMYNKVMNLVHLRYMVVPVESVESNGKEHVYDISMTLGVEPAFVANGVVVHNTADSSMTVFIENLRAYRDMITRQFFYNKLFPMISLVNGYTVNSKGKLIRKDGLMSSDNVQENLDKLADGSRMLIPSVHWAKQLKPEGDSQYMDMLQSLTEKGVPVPLRALAAAGGFNIDTLLSHKEDDLEMLKKIQQYSKDVKEVKDKYGPKQEEEGGGMGGFASSGNASMMEQMYGEDAPLRSRMSLADRDFGEQSEIMDKTKTGKPKYIHNQKRANEKSNREIAKALSRVTENKSTPLTNTTKTPKKPGNKKSKWSS